MTKKNMTKKKVSIDAPEEAEDVVDVPESPTSAEQFAPFMGCPPREIVSVVAHELGHIVTTIDGGQYLVALDGAVGRLVETTDPEVAE